MKKKLLFIMPNLGSGGAEKALLTLLNLFDYDSYEVDLMLFRREGLFLGDVPEQVNIIDGGEDYLHFDGSSAAYLKSALTHLRAGAALNRIAYSKALSSGDRGKVWSCLKKVLTKPTKHYDTAVAYLEGNSIYYCIDCVDAERKIGYIHNDYDGLGLDKDFDRVFFRQLDYLVTVSDECAQVLKKNFPESTEKIRMLENLISPAMLKSLANGRPDEYPFDDKKILLTVGRLSQQKGYDIAIDAAEILKKKGYNFKWFSIGKGELLAELEERIRQKGLEDFFVFLGERANPYPYINGCDIYVQPSYFEGKSVAINEAKIFAKPIAATKFATVFDQLTDGETALLAEINAESVAERIAQLFENESLCHTLGENLKKEKIGNEEEIDKFYKLVEGKL